MPKREKCGLKSCENILGPGAAEVGYVDEELNISKVRVCHEHAWKIMTSRGACRITPDLTLEQSPVVQHFIPKGNI